MPDIALTGKSKAFFRAFGGSNQYSPDATTIGSIGRAQGGDADMNLQLDNVNQAATPGEGFIASPGEEFTVRWIGWTNANCVIQEYNFFNAAWETIYTWTTPLSELTFKIVKHCSFRIGTDSIGADGATLKHIIQFNQGNF